MTTKKTTKIVEDAADITIETVQSPTQTAAEVQATPADEAATTKSIFVKSNGIETIKKDKKKHVYGYVNGIYFEVPCDKQVDVPLDVAEALAGLLEAQSKVSD